MPRLVLFDDNGRQIFAGDVSHANVETVARFLRSHMTTLRVAAEVNRGVGELVNGVGNLADKLGPLLDFRVAGPTKPRPRALPRRKARR
jgi:hypothetical protein